MQYSGRGQLLQQQIVANFDIVQLLGAEMRNHFEAFFIPLDAGGEQDRVGLINSLSRRNVSFIYPETSVLAMAATHRFQMGVYPGH
jgi:hypothetical protein